jgi:hypothetical protein
MKNKDLTLKNYTFDDIRSYIYILILGVFAVYFVLIAYNSEKTTFLFLTFLLVVYFTITIFKIKKAWIIENKIVYGNPIFKKFQSIEIDKVYLITFNYSSNAAISRRLQIRETLSEREIIEVSEKKHQFVIDYLIQNFNVKIEKKSRHYE